MTYQEQLKSPLWQRKRLEMFQRDNFTCVCCGNSKLQLHLHHGVYIKGLKAWEYDDKYLHTLCDVCHDTTTLLMADIYKSIGELNPSFLWDYSFIFKWLKTNDAEELRKWIIEKENKNGKGTTLL